MTLHISNDVPFGQTLYAWLILCHRSLPELTGKSNPYNPGYLAWETVRKGGNPFFVNGTGFEGYFVGQCVSAEQAMEAIIGVCQELLDRLARFYRFDYRFKSRLMYTLHRETADTRAMHEWSAQFGATVARLRCLVHGNPAARLFQSRTYQLVSTRPVIAYEQVDHSLHQDYTIWTRSSERDRRLLVDMRILKPADQDAWMIADLIGEFGHPLIREYLSEQPPGALYR